MHHKKQWPHKTEPKNKKRPCQNFDKTLFYSILSSKPVTETPPTIDQLSNILFQLLVKERGFSYWGLGH